MRHRVPLLVAAAALSLAACGSDGEPATDSATGSGSGTAAEVPSVVATTTMWADITRNVACDGLAEITTIIPAGGDPHSFEPSLRDRETMGNAALIVANGLGLEESLEDTIDAVEADGTTVVRVGEFVDTLPAGDDDHDDGDHDDGDHDDGDHDDEVDTTTDEATDDDHDHGADDPHIWFDPTRVTATLPAIADGLAGAGVDRAALDACVAEYSSALAALDNEVSAIVDSLPVGDRLLVTNHDSLSYFADRYGFTILGSVIPSPSSLAATNPADLEALATLITETGVPAIFAETQHSSSDTQALADRVGDVEVVTLQTDTLGEPGSDTDDYTSWLTATARSIVDALSE
jgi:ABC-type Zn uptake system ZnuABC Zn-binding protein ZnuA